MQNHRTLLRRLLLLGLTALVLALALPAGAQELPKDRLVFQSAVSKSAMEKTIERSIESAIDDMSFLIKPVAKGRLEESNQAVPWVMFETKQPGKLTVQIAGRGPVTAPASGAPTKWTAEDGETVRVEQELADHKVTQVFKAEDGTKSITYDFADDFQTMTMKVTVTSPKLPAPLVYELPFKRAEKG